MSKKPNVLDNLREIAPKLVELTEQVAYADVWERPELSKRDRSLITVAALGQTDIAGARLTNEVQFLYDQELQWEQNTISSI